MKWFKPFYFIYLPISIAGYLVTIAAVIFLIPVYTAIIRNGHSVSDDLYSLFVFTSCTAFWWKWIAEKTS